MRRFVLLLPVLLVSQLLVAVPNPEEENKEIARPEGISPPSTGNSSESYRLRQRVEPTPIADFEEEGDEPAREEDYFEEDDEIPTGESDEGSNYGY